MSRRQPRTAEIVEAQKMPLTPDPYWPAGASPNHLSVEEQQSKEVQESFAALVTWKCERCGATLDQSVSDSRYCSPCFDLESQNSALAQKVNSNWMEQAKELGLELYERQPEETDLEWFIWQTYRSYYPLKLPTWSALATACKSGVNTVVKASSKWSYKVRMIAWARETDAGMQETRIAAIKEMNEKQLTAAKTIQEKLSLAIECLDPRLLKPNEIVSLFKVASDLERKIVTSVDEKVLSDATDSKARQMSLTKPEDLADVISILQKTGVLDEKTLGIEQTTRIIAKDETDG